MKERLIELREIHLNKKQKEMAEKLNISRATYGRYETGEIKISDRVITDICREYKVNEKWLRTGEGSWNQEMTEKEKLIARIDEVYDGPNDFHKQALHVLAEMSPEEIRILQTMADRIIAERQNKDKT